MLIMVLRGLSKITAALTGLLLTYGITYTLEGITTRVPVSAAHELAISTLWMLPWMLLICSGSEDFGKVAHQPSVFWVGVTLGLVLVLYLERNTTSGTVTRALMPPLAAAGGMLPHIIRRVRFVFAICSLAFGIAGVGVLYFALRTMISASFATKPIGVLVVAFGIAATATGVLALVTLTSPARHLASK